MTLQEAEDNLGKDVVLCNTSNMKGCLFGLTKDKEAIVLWYSLFKATVVSPEMISLYGKDWQQARNGEMTRDRKTLDAEDIALELRQLRTRKRR
jgi:hypothetical protein